MSSEDRNTLLATIWVSMGLASIGVAVASSHPEIMLFPIGVALLVTIIMVTIPDILAALTSNREKTKRQSQDKLSILLEMMDDDERAAFKEMLKQRVLDDLEHDTGDGELPADDATLAALLDAQQSRPNSRQ